MIDIKNKEINRNINKYYLCYSWGNYGDGYGYDVYGNIDGNGNGYGNWDGYGNGEGYGGNEMYFYEDNIYIGDCKDDLYVMNGTDERGGNGRSRVI
jgi:hypothetical protein